MLYDFVYCVILPTIQGLLVLLIYDLLRHKDD